VAGETAGAFFDSMLNPPNACSELPSDCRGLITHRKGIQKRCFQPFQVAGLERLQHVLAASPCCCCHPTTTQQPSPELITADYLRHDNFRGPIPAQVAGLIDRTHQEAFSRLVAGLLRAFYDRGRTKTLTGE